ncbi:MAG TPA: multicopper oxidase domain-containing protein [Terriglobales bacterium]|nr:multicopper oxidase domain-containing protein [Terriglobales bacterium]
MTQDSLISRRDFLKLATLAGGAVGLSACAPALATATPTMADMQTGGTGGTAADMDAMHEAGVKTFLDNIGKDTKFWGQPLTPRNEDGFKVFEIRCQNVQWETKPGETVAAMAYNGIVPGPEIRITEGDKVRVVVTNEMDQSTAVHFHGVLLPNNMDGVPFITQPPIKPGETFTYEFTARNPGTHIYHSHHNAAEQVTKGLFGAFLVEPADKAKDPDYDAEYTLTLNDTGIGLTLNGKSFPYTQPILAKLGDRVRIRYMNEGLLIHPMHLHGLEQLVFAKDGWALPQPYTCDTLNIAPGERYDVIVNCHTAGAWAFHCHILTHAESAMGMFGMVTALVVQ